jgi:hypothetical protein
MQTAGFSPLLTGCDPEGLHGVHVRLSEKVLALVDEQRSGISWPNVDVQLGPAFVAAVMDIELTPGEERRLPVAP